MKKILGLSTAALLAVLTVTGCSVSDKDGKAWAEANGYVKYEDTYTSGSATSSYYPGIYEEGDALAAAMAKYQGQYLYVTTNPDGSTNVAFFIPGTMTKNSTTGKYEITQTFGNNEEGGVVQTVANLIREGKGTLIYSNYGYHNIVADETYTAVEGVAPTYAKNKYYAHSDKYTVVASASEAPTWAANKYYSYDSSTQKYTLTTSAPADWATTYTNYYTHEDVYEVVSSDEAPADWETETSKYYTHEDVYTLVASATTAPTYEANKYYTRSGTEGSYEYTVVSSDEAPADWATTYTTYYTHEDVYSAAAVAPEWKTNTYYSIRYGLKSLTSSQPADWATNYASYYTVEYSNIHQVDYSLGADSNDVISTQINFTVKSTDTSKGYYAITLQVESFEKIA